MAGFFHLQYLHFMSEVVLRKWKREDAQQLAALANNKNIWLNVRDRFPHPYSVLNALQWMEQHKNEQPQQHFCIEYKRSVAGGAGIIVKDDIYKKSIEIGYFIGEPFWNKGIATKAVNLLLHYIAHNFDVVRIYAEVFEHNKASMNVLLKNGFYLEGIRKNAVIKNGVIMSDYVWVKLT